MDKRNKTVPRLSKIKKENVFRVPGGYFEELPRRVQEAIKKDKAEVQPSWFRAYLRLHPGMAAAILGFAVIGYVAVRFLITDPVTNELSSGEVAEYVEYYASELEEGMLLEIIDDIQTDVTDDEYDELMINYLLDQDIDYRSIIEEL